MNEPRPTLNPSQGHPVHPQPVHPQPVHPQPGPRPLTSPGLAGAAPAQAIPRPLGAPAIARPLSNPAAGSPGAESPAARPAITPAPQGLPRHGNAAAINPAAAPPKPVEDEPVALVEDGDDDLSPAATSTMSKIKQFGSDLGVKKHDWKRQPKMLGNGAVRVKTFHAKLSDQGLEYLDEAVNVFIDEHPEVDIKFVTTNIGMFDGKFKDLALIVNLWY